MDATATSVFQVEKTIILEILLLLCLKLFTNNYIL